MTVAQALSELLFEFDAVTVTGLGTFTCDYESARVNVVTNRFERPSATVVFDGQRREENDLLVRHLAVSDGITEEEARQQVARFVADCFAALKAGHEVTLPGIGTLRPDAGQAVAFTPVASNFNGDAFGLHDFSPPPVYGGNSAVDWRAQVARQLKDQNTPMTVDSKAVHEDLGDERVFERHRRRRVLLPLLTLLLLIPALLLILYFLEVIHFDLPFGPKPSVPVVAVRQVPPPDSAMQSLLVRYDWVPAVEAEQETELDTATVAVADTAVAATLDTPPSPTTDPPTHQPAQPSAGETTSSLPPTTSQPSLATDSPSSEILPYASMLNYAIIGGCFSQQANAERYVEPIRGQGYSGAFLMKKDGMYYVCYGQYGTLDEAKTALVGIQADANPKAWILTK